MTTESRIAKFAAASRPSEQVLAGRRLLEEQLQEQGYRTAPKAKGPAWSGWYRKDGGQAHIVRVDGPMINVNGVLTSGPPIGYEIEYVGPGALTAEDVADLFAA